MVTLGRLRLFLKDVEILLSRYPDGGTAVLLVEEATGEPVGQLSLNVPNLVVGEAEFFAKTTEENELFREPLLSSGFFRDTGVRIPFLDAEVWQILTA